MGNKNQQNIMNSTVGAAAVGANASARGEVTTATTTDAEAWARTIKSAQAGLVQDQDRLDDLEEGMYEAFSQLLRMVRQIQIDQLATDELHRQIKDAVDETWAEHQIKKLRGVDPDTLEVLKALKGPAEAILKALVS